MYLGDPPERHDVPLGGAHPRRSRDTRYRRRTMATTDLLVYAYGMPPENENAELLDSGAVGI